MFKMYGKICQYKILFPKKTAYKYEGDIQIFFRGKKQKRAENICQHQNCTIRNIKGKSSGLRNWSQMFIKYALKYKD